MAVHEKDEPLVVCVGTPAEPQPLSQPESQHDNPRHDAHQSQMPISPLSANSNADSQSPRSTSSFESISSLGHSTELSSMRSSESDSPVNDMISSIHSLARPLEEASYTDPHTHQNPMASPVPRNADETLSQSRFARPGGDTSFVMPYPTSREARSPPSPALSQAEAELRPRPRPGPRPALSRENLARLLAELRLAVDTWRSSSALQSRPPHDRHPSPPPNTQPAPEHGSPVLSSTQDSTGSRGSSFSWVRLTPDPGRYRQHLLHSEDTGEYLANAPVSPRSPRLSSPDVPPTSAPQSLEEPATVGHLDRLGNLSPPPVSPARPLEEVSVLDYITVPVRKDEDEGGDSGAQLDRRSSVSG